MLAAPRCRLKGALFHGFQRPGRAGRGDRRPDPGPPQIEELGFSVYGRGHRPTDSLGRVSIQEADTTIRLGVEVRTGDLIMADEDGITVVPRERAEEAVERAVAKATTENKARDLLLAGGTLADVWERFHVL